MLILITLAFAANSTPWQSHGTSDGISLETRAIEGSAFEEIRVSKNTNIPPLLVADAIWGTGGVESVANHVVKHHRLLSEVENERVYYEIVSVPLISDRDYVVSLKRLHEGELFEFPFTTLDGDPTYPVQTGKVRMRFKGSSVVEPNGSGGSIVTHELFSDLGGSLPAFLTRGAQRDAAVEWLKTMVSRAQKLLAANH